MLYLLLLTAIQFQPAMRSAGKIEKEVLKMLANPEFEDGFWGIAVYSPLRDKMIISHHENKNFRPASNMKIVTTLVAFEHLGPSYSFETAFFYRGTLQNGVLDGDLVVQGFGDPSFSGHYSDGTTHTRELIQQLAQRIKDHGIHEIRGEIIALENFFDDRAIQTSWEWDDCGTYYGTPVSALSLNDGWVDIRVETDSMAVPRMNFFPEATGDVFVFFEEDLSKLTESHEEPDVLRQWGTNNFTLKGRWLPCESFELSRSVWDPALQYVQVVKRALEEEGVQVHGTSRVVDQLPQAELVYLFSHDSPSLSELAKVLMKESQNHYADCFIKTTAKRMTGEGSFENGAMLSEALIQKALENMPWDKQRQGFNMKDGSGLSTHNAVQPIQLAALLNRGLSAPYWRQWLKSMPIMGVDGTLKRRGSKDGRTKGRVWAKTGYIFRSRALSGYLETLDGEPLVFSILANNYSCPTRRINQVQDNVCSVLMTLKANKKVKRSPERFQLSRYLIP
ncbi:MAG: D-alanyl-D-alanine carboxypeptidase/D-alanyl-D-alanine-endopeptidase [Acidobacteria bacterium]|nr:MAG: D-alanyl-D-alanine carboxypeptidase/D-alanyl-D-alanine-endopeptidase [Acidobacteriota bacterium]